MEPIKLFWEQRNLPPDHTRNELSLIPTHINPPWSYPPTEDVPMKSFSKASVAYISIMTTWILRHSNLVCNIFGCDNSLEFSQKINEQSTVLIETFLFFDITCCHAIFFLPRRALGVWLSSQTRELKSTQLDKLIIAVYSVTSNPFPSFTLKWHLIVDVTWNGFSDNIVSLLNARHQSRCNITRRLDRKC